MYGNNCEGCGQPCYREQLTECEECGQFVCDDCIGIGGNLCAECESPVLAGE